MLAENIAELQNLLRKRRMTEKQLQEKANLGMNTVRRFLEEYRAELHIAAYLPDSRGRLITRAYRWGKKQDAARPGPQRTSTDRMRDLRNRQKESS